MQTSRSSIGAIVFVAALSLALAGALAHDATKYPDWSGQWTKPGRFGNQWDPTKPPGLGQQAPLTPEIGRCCRRASPTRLPADKAAIRATPASALACRGL